MHRSLFVRMLCDLNRIWRFLLIPGGQQRYDRQETVAIVNQIKSLVRIITHLQKDRLFIRQLTNDGILKSNLVMEI